MDTIIALVHKHGNRRVGARVWNMLGHFLHDERVADKQSDDSRCVLTGFFLHNSALIKLHKQHQSCFAQAFLDCAFQLGKRARFVSRSPEFSHVRMTDSRINSRHNLIERFRGRKTESLNLDFSNHFEALS
jgi:hypothetical protein